MTRRLALLTLALSGAGQAATLTVDARGADGRALPGAVVSLEVPGLPPAVPRGPYVVAQRNISFDPRVLVVPVGATVAFPNQDKVRHHVYSFSRPKRFELKLYGREEARQIVFDKPGPVALGCNIHDRMSGLIYVTPHRFAAAADGAGRVSFAGVPRGRATVLVWDPSIRAPGNLFRQPVELASDGTTAAVITAR